MDEALIKPQKVRRAVLIRPTAPVIEGSVAREPDVVARGTLVEVSDPRALRPREFRADFVYGPQASAEDVALCDLPPLLESVLGGTDALLLVAGAADAGQAEVLDGPRGLCAQAVGRLASELQARQARHRQGGTGGYSFQFKLSSFRINGDRIDDLLTEQPEVTRLVDTPQGVVIEGLRAPNIAGPEEGVHLVEVAQRQQDPNLRGRVATVLSAEITQADYFAGWGLFGRLLIIELPALDCLAEDRGLVQLREGYETFRGVFHLRGLVHAWKAGEPGDVNGSALTWVLRELLCGGSVSATTLLCLRQQQPAVSRVLLEMLDDMGKVQTNPVCCDHRVAGLARALRSECLLYKSFGVGGRLLGDRDSDEDNRRLILELERRLRAAERGREEVAKAEEQRKGRAADLGERYLCVVQGQELLHQRLVASKEEHIRACEGLVELQLEHTEAKDELSELRYKDSMLMMLLEQEVADMQLASREQRDLANAMEARASSEALARGELESRLEALQSSEGLSHDQAKRLITAQQRVEALQLSLDTMSEAKMQADIAREVDRGRLENRLEALQNEMRKGVLDSALAHAEERERYLKELQEATSREEGPLRELQTLRRAVSELSEQLELESAAGRRAREEGDASALELLRLREELQRALTSMLAGTPAPGTPLEPAAPTRERGSAVARTRLAELGQESAEHQQRLALECRQLQAHVMELQRQLAWASRAALDWAPPDASAADKARLQEASHDAARKATAAAEAAEVHERSVREELVQVRSELERQQQHLLATRAEHDRELRRREVEMKRLEAQLLEHRGRGSSPSAVQALPPLAAIQQQLLSEVDALRRRGVGLAPAAPTADASQGDQAAVLEENRALRARLERLEQQTPANQRMQLQRLTFLEKSMRELEAERSGLLVRANVAEEQLTQLQRHLKEMTESYQMQILNLKLQAKAR